MKFETKKITMDDINGIIKRIYAPLLIAILVILSLISLWICYQYVFKILWIQPSSEMTVEMIDSATLKEVLIQKNERKEKLDRVWISNYPDPFN